MKKLALVLGLFLLAGTVWAQSRGSDPSSYLVPTPQQFDGFSIQPPAGWWVSKPTSKYLAKFAEQSYQAWIIVNAVQLSEPIRLNEEFIEFVGKQNSEVKRGLPSFTAVSNRYVEVNGASAYRTEAIFQAGPNKAFISIYYVPAGTRVYMIMTICPEVTARKWDQVFSASVQTFRATQ